MSAPKPDDSRPSILLAVTSATSLTLMDGFPEFLAAEGWRVHVVASDPSSSATRLGSEISVHSISMKREPSIVFDVKALLRWLLLLRTVRPDVVMAGTPKAGLLALVTAKASGVRTRVYLLRGLRLETESGWRRRMLWVMEWVAANAAHSVLAVSPSLRDEFVAHRLCKPAQISVLGWGSSNGVDVGRTPSPQDMAAIGKQRPFGTEGLVIGFVGRASEDKGIRTMLRALKRIEGCPGLAGAVFVGPSEPDGYLDGEIEALQLDRRRLWVVGPVVDPTPYYKQMDLLCLPTRREGFPNVVLEAAVQGVPSAVADATGARDAVVHGETGFIFPVDDDEVLGSLIRSLCNSPSALKQVGDSARRHAHEKFDRSVVWRAQLTFLERLHQRR